jgi:hypothetical protein
MRRALARRGSGVLVLAVLLACLLRPAAAGAADATFGASVRRAADATFDVLILRPTGLAVSVVGLGLFVPAALFSAPGGEIPVREAWDRFVVTPVRYTFTRPLGDF